MEGSERRKAVELLKEMRNENNMNDEKSSNNETRLKWMYKGPSDLVDREEYLLGKAIDKTFELLNSGNNSEELLGRTGEQSNVPKRLLEKSDSIEQVDIAKKILEDPLYAIKQKEMEARKKLLNNPVKLKQIKQMLLERNKQSSAYKKKKKLKKKSEQDLNLLILRKLKKLTDKEKQKALNKIIQSDSSSGESSSFSKKEKRNKTKKKRSFFISDESDSCDASTSYENVKAQRYKKNKEQSKKKMKGNKVKPSSESDSSCDKRKKISRKEKLVFRENHRESSSNSKCSSSNDDEKGRNYQAKTPVSKSRFDKREYEHKSRRNRSVEAKDKYKEKKKLDKRDESSGDNKRIPKTYGLMMPNGSKPEVKRSSHKREYEKNADVKAKYVPPPKAKTLSEKEREELLEEMKKDAKLRKEDREKNLASHRKKQEQEEKHSTYDDDFMRRQMSHLTSHGTMADRIKSNINNIQRFKSSMDSSFMKK